MVEFLGVEFYSCFDCEVADNGTHEFNSIFLLVDVVGDITLRVILLGQPVEDISYEFEVRAREILEGDYAIVVEGS